MKKHQLLFLSLFLPVMVLAEPTSVFVKADVVDGADGSSWDNALSFADFKTKVSDGTIYDEGTTFYFGGGTYTITDTIKVYKGYSIIGGYNPASTGSEPGTPSASYRTIFDGDNQTGCLFTFSGTTTKSISAPMTFENLEFTKCKYTRTTFYDAAAGKEKNINDDVTKFSIDYSNNVGALWLSNCDDVTVRNCKFYGNESLTFGGMAITSRSTNLYVVDSEFYENKAVSRGAAVRLFCNKDATGETVFERCVFKSNVVTYNGNAAGSAILMQHGQKLYLVNCTVADNSAKQGGAVYANGKETNSNYSRIVYVVNSTIAGNTGGQLQMTHGANLHIANSIIVGNGGSDRQEAAVLIRNYNNGDHGLLNITMDGHNMIGNMASDATAIDFVSLKQQSDAVSAYNNYQYVFGARELDGNKLDPEIFLSSMTIAELADIKTSYEMPEQIDLTVDQFGTSRDGEYQICGAYTKTQTSTGFDITVGSLGYSTLYIDGGFEMPDALMGAYLTRVHDANAVYLSYKFNKRNKNVPAKSAIILRGTPGTYHVDYKMMSRDGDPNLLRGTFLAATTTVSPIDNDTREGLTEDNVYFYQLTIGDLSPLVGFYWAKAGGVPFTNGANKCYLYLSKEEASSAKGIIFMDDYDLMLRVDDQQTTSIISLTSNPSKGDGNIYDMAGRMIATSSQSTSFNTLSKGIYIINGKKYIVR